MSTGNQDVGDLWNRILAVIAEKVQPGCFDTWFQPLRALRLNGSVLQVTVPTETFHESFAENYMDLLRQAAVETAGTGIELRLSTPEPEPPHGEGCAHDGKVQPLPVVRASDLETPAYSTILVDRAALDAPGRGHHRRQSQKRQDMAGPGNGCLRGFRQPVFRHLPCLLTGPRTALCRGGFGRNPPQPCRDSRPVAQSKLRAARCSHHYRRFTPPGSPRPSGQA